MKMKLKKLRNNLQTSYKNINASRTSKLTEKHLLRSPFSSVSKLSRQSAPEQRLQPSHVSLNVVRKVEVLPFNVLMSNAVEGKTTLLPMEGEAQYRPIAPKPEEMKTDSSSSITGKVFI